MPREFFDKRHTTIMLAAILATLFTIVELNCENLFDYTHDEGKNDYEYLPTSTRKWDKGRYWKKLNNTARTLLSCGGEGEAWALPDLLVLTEVENDSVMHDLTKRSLLRNAGYEYVMTASDDERGIDVALAYSPFSFRLLHHHSLRVAPMEGRHATRDILYANGLLTSGDTLHVLVVHAPSRVDGERATRPYRLKVAERITQAIDSIRSSNGEALIVVAGDFNVSSPEEFAPSAAAGFKMANTAAFGSFRTRKLAPEPAAGLSGAPAFAYDHAAACLRSFNSRTPTIPYADVCKLVFSMLSCMRNRRK